MVRSKAAKSRSPAARCQKRQAETDFEYCDCRRPDCLRRLCVEPALDGRFARNAHRGREHVGIDEDH